MDRFINRERFGDKPFFFLVKILAEMRNNLGEIWDNLHIFT